MKTTGILILILILMLASSCSWLTEQQASETSTEDYSTTEPTVAVAAATTTTTEPTTTEPTTTIFIPTTQRRSFLCEELLSLDYVYSVFHETGEWPEENAYISECLGSDGNTYHGGFPKSLLPACSSNSEMPTPNVGSWYIKCRKDYDWLIFASGTITANLPPYSLIDLPYNARCYINKAGVANDWEEVACTRLGDEIRHLQYAN